jgi:trehalose/maltose hydrolase-like predicted phosphorylase
MYPPLLMLQPDLAKSMLRYRLDRQAGAQHKAQMNGYRGLMFPWESAESGEEVQGSSYNQVGPWGQYEQHISGDIALAAWQYWKMTRDLDFLASDLEPLLRGVAEFWVSRVTKGSDGLYHILQVMGPDEYHYPVDDSAYTNAAALVSLNAAVEAANFLNRNVNPAWLDIATNLYIPFNATLQIHPEFANYTGDTVKQADTVLLGYPMGLDMNATVRANDVNYYAARYMLVCVCV